MGHNELYLMRQDYLAKNYEYRYCHHSEFNYSILQNVMYLYRSGNSKKKVSYNNVIIMADTETSRKKLKISANKTKLPSGFTARDNHICAWTISVRAFDMNICTLWGHKPTTFCDTLAEIIDQFLGDITIVYFHNMAYDYTFLRRFLFKKFGKPVKALNIKPHYPLFLRFSNGLEIRDSLILAQKKLEDWAKDLKVDHQKSVGKWNYKKFRSQEEKYNKDELEYIEHDTLAGVECIQKLMDNLNKRVYSMPYTATGIIRMDIREIGLMNGANDLFRRIAPTYDQYIKLTQLFHGGYVHANRFYIDELITEDDPEFGLVECYDFASSYPFCICVFKFPMEAFTPMPDMSLKDIVERSENTAYMFKFIAYKIRLKDPNISNPSLQFSKCLKGSCINPVLDNGRILEADYIEIYLNEIDAQVIRKQYTAESSICTEVEAAYKDYLPRWFTDYVFSRYKDKCLLKYSNMPIDYAISKTKANGCYGLTVQKSIQDVILEDYETLDVSSAYKIDKDDDIKEQEKKDRKTYEKYLNKKNNVLVYQWGCWVTSYAFRNLFVLSECVSDDGLLLYNDTDSGYAIKWDKDKIAAYNERCLELLRANNYDEFTIDDHTFRLGAAEHEGAKDEYTSFKVMGAKRYAGRCKKDGKIHITVAGVPKESGAKCLKDDLNAFTDGFKFKGKETGKLMHTYFYHDIWTDADGNESADSIDLLPCDYKLDSTEQFDFDAAFTDEIEMEGLFYEYF